MIQIINNFITDIECDELVSFYKTNISFTFSNLDDNIYHFNAINITKKINNFSFTKKLFKQINNINLEGNGTLRIQHLDSTIKSVEIPHTHTLPYSLVVFLNDDFGGGELIFDNIRITPKKGQLFYFNGDEKHYVNTVTYGDRYTLVSFLKSNINFYKTNLI
jgi:predicted 2-oxoglutarate/Fe(II)-dependent dioxygenase YbiX